MLPKNRIQLLCKCPHMAIDRSSVREGEAVIAAGRVAHSSSTLSPILFCRCSVSKLRHKPLALEKKKKHQDLFKIYICNFPAAQRCVTNTYT